MTACASWTTEDSGMKKTLGCIRKADTDFSLIEDGDHIAIGVSGGKDSLLLLHALKFHDDRRHRDHGA